MSKGEASLLKALFHWRKLQGTKVSLAVWTPVE